MRLDDTTKEDVKKDTPQRLIPEKIYVKKEDE